MIEMLLFWLNKAMLYLCFSDFHSYHVGTKLLKIRFKLGHAMRSVPMLNRDICQVEKKFNTFKKYTGFTY